MMNARKSTWKRLRHNAANAAAWFLVLLAVGVSGLWVDWRDPTTAYWQWLDPEHGTKRTLHVLSAEHVVRVAWHRFATSDQFLDEGQPAWSITWRNPRVVIQNPTTSPSVALPWNSFALSRRQYDRLTGAVTDGVAYYLVFPHWFLLLLLLPWPAKRGWGWLKLRRRRQMGLCLTCGYDLRESPVRCPECGAARAAKDEIRNSNDESNPKNE